MYLKKHQICKSKSSYMKMFLGDKYGKSIECESFLMHKKNCHSTRALYILDKKRKYLIVNEEFGLQLLQEKKDEDELELWMQVSAAI